MNKQMIIDYEEYVELTKKLNELNNFKNKMEDCFKFDCEETHPHIITKTVFINKSELKKIFAVDNVILEEKYEK